MITVTERPDGTRKVAISFPTDEVVIRRLSDDRKAFYEDFVSVSRTKPEFAKEVDLPTIMKKYDRTGIIDPLLYRDMEYGDFTSGLDFTEAAMKYKDAMYDFSNLPAEVRNAVDNDPAKLIDIINDPDPTRAIELGLKSKPAAPPAVPPAVSPAPVEPVPAP